MGNPLRRARGLLCTRSRLRRRGEPRSESGARAERRGLPDTRLAERGADLARAGAAARRTDSSVVGLRWRTSVACRRAEERVLTPRSAVRERAGVPVRGLRVGASVRGQAAVAGAARVLIGPDAGSAEQCLWQE